MSSVTIEVRLQLIDARQIREAGIGTKPSLADARHVSRLPRPGQFVFSGRR